MTPPSKVWLWVFWLAVVADLAAVYFQWNQIRYISKPAIVTSLLIYFLLAARQNAGSLLFKLALILSLAGDVALLFEDRDPLFFMVGLGCFLLAHFCYIMAFTYIYKRNIALQGGKKWPMRPVWTIATGLYVVGLFYFLRPYLGEMQIPVVAYAAALGLMLVTVIRAYPKLYSKPGIICLAGALFFVISDSLLAINKFYMGFPMAGIAIMLTYALAQYLLTMGAVRTYSTPNFAPHPAS